MLHMLLMLADSGVRVEWGLCHGLFCFGMAVLVVIGLVALAGHGPRKSFNDPPPADDDNK